MEKMENKAKDITTRDIEVLMAETYADTNQYACAFEVGNSTGYRARRHVDFVAVDCWPSHGLKISAFEFKISKSDFRNELLDPSKHNIFFDEIDEFSIVAPDYVLDNMNIIPPKWGVYHVVRNSDGELELKTKRKPLALHDEPLKERKISRDFMCSLVRAINKQSHVRALVYKERDELREKIKKEVESKLANGGIVISEYEYNELKGLRDVCIKLGIHVGYRGLSEYDAKHFREAKDVADHLHYLRSSLNTAMSNFKSVYKQVDDLLESIKKNGGNLSEALGSMAEKLTPEDVANGLSEKEPETQNKENHEGN